MRFVMASKPLLFLAIAFLTTCLVQASNSTTNSNHSPNIFYLSYIGNKTAISKVPAQQLTELLNGDDFPFVRVELPWQLNFFGLGIENVYVSPNGAIHATPLAPCPQCYCFSIDSLCSYNNSYYGIMAGFNADLFPGKYNGPNITAAIGSDFVNVYYYDVPFYLESLNNSFGITMFKDSSIQLYWTQVYPQSTKSGGLMVGFRNFLNNSLTTFSASQLKVGMQYDTTVQGIYPPIADVVAGNAFTACPVSTVWCATPAVMAKTSLSNLTLTPLSISCLNSVEFVLYVSGSSTSSPVTVDLSSGSAYVIPCKATPSNSLICDLNELQPQFVTESTLSLSVAWRQRGTYSDYEALSLLDPLSIQINSQTSTTCAINEVVSQCGDPCKLCTSNYSCLSLPCDNSTDPVLYKYPVCNNTCYGSHSYHDLYYDSNNGNCCSEDDMDCNGDCYGTREIAPTSTGILVCCPADSIDCNGICDGDSVPDACGVCGGSDISGKYCNNGVIVQTNTAVPNSLDAFVSVMDSDAKFAVFNVNFTNINSTSVNIELSIANEISKSKIAPAIFLAQRSYSVFAHESLLIPVNISLSGLVSGAQTGWMVKQIYVSFTRDGSDKEYMYLINVYPAVLDCPAVTEYETCIQMPACIYCNDYAYIRILREIDGEFTEADKAASRKLYPDLLPGQLLNHPDYISGSCTNGWNRTVCHGSSFSTSSAPNQWNSLNSIKLLVLMFIGYVMVV